jgi:prevent-host-death family protein
MKGVIMLLLPQTELISNLKNHYEQVVSKLAQGPVLLMQRSKPSAVLVSVAEWERASRRLVELEEREMIRQRLQRAHASPGVAVSLEEFTTQLLELDPNA